MSQSSKCPHFDEQAKKCNMLRQIAGQGDKGSRACQMYAMMGVEQADWRSSFCSTSKWTECGVYCNDQKGMHR